MERRRGEIVAPLIHFFMLDAKEIKVDHKWLTILMSRNEDETAKTERRSGDMVLTKQGSGWIKTSTYILHTG